MAAKWNYYYSNFIINFSSYYYLNIIEGRMEQESFRLIAENDNYYFDYFYFNFIIRYYSFDFMEGKSLAGSLLKIMNESKVFTNKKLNLILERIFFLAHCSNFQNCQILLNHPFTIYWHLHCRFSLDHELCKGWTFWKIWILLCDKRTDLNKM